MKKNKNSTISENDIIYKYLSKLHFNKKESFKFKNDGAILVNKNTHDMVVTNDTIVESVDFFSNDSPESIAQKIVTYNLSDISAMGAETYSYTLSLSLPEAIGQTWIKKFVNKLFFLQKKYNFFLLGGDISLSKKIHISANFYGYVKKKLILKREQAKIGDNIWVTGNLGDSFIGLSLLKKTIKINKKFNKYFLNKYLYPEPCLIGSKINKFSNCAIDISDGFLGDLTKLFSKNTGAKIDSSKIPFSNYALKLIKLNKISPITLMNSGDDYELIFTSSDKFTKKIIEKAIQNKIKLTKVGRIADNKGILLDSEKLLNSNNSYQYIF